MTITIVNMYLCCINLGLFLDLQGGLGDGCSGKAPYINGVKNMSYHPLVLKHFLLDNNAGEKSVRSTHFGVCIQINKCVCPSCSQYD